MTNYFEKLNQIDVSAHTEKKGNFTYLSWAWAIEQLGKVHPEAIIKTKTNEHGFPAFYSPQGQAMVWVTVEIDNVVRGQPYPVLDYRNQAVNDPDIFTINTSLQRALVKAISLHGLGLYIYAGEDLPPDAPDYTAKQKSDFDALFKEGEAYNFWLMWQALETETKTALFSTFEKGTITKNKDKVRKLEADGLEVFNNLKMSMLEHIDNGDAGGLKEIGEELSSGKALAFHQLSAESQAKAKELMA